MRSAGRNFAIAAAALGAVGLSACGSSQHQNAGEPSGNFRVQVPVASFPAKQALSQHSQLVIKVRNTGRKTIPDVAVSICNTTCQYPAPVGEGTSVEAFAYYLKMPGLAYHSRPVWIVDQPPGLCAYSCLNGGRGTDFVINANTWAAGSLKPGATATFVWKVTAVTPGSFRVAWRVAAGIYGKAKAVLANGTLPHGSFAVNIAHAPAQAYVTDGGQVASGG